MPGRDIHIYSMYIEADGETVGKFARTLAPDETARAARYRFDHLRRAFVLARGALRVLLGRRLNCPPQDIEFRYGGHGKPSLAGPPALEFNISHSGGLAVFAFAEGAAVGIDLEKVRPMGHMADIAARYFSPGEIRDLLSLPASRMPRAFFSCWTRKEAYIKASGDGLPAPLHGFRVSLLPGQPARLLSIAGSAAEAAQWSMHDVEVPEGFAGALVYLDAERRIIRSPAMQPAELWKGD